MEGYRHLNVLVSCKTYEELREASHKLHNPVSAIVRQGIDRVLKNPSCKCEGAKN